MNNALLPHLISSRPIRWGAVPLLAIFACAGLSVLSAQEEKEAEVFELSPFQVTADDEIGYLATQTLAGTRIRTDLKDVGAAITVLTKEFLEDVGAVNFEEALEYSPNTSSFETDFGSNNDGTSTRSENLYSVRGFANNSYSRDFFPSLYQPDFYSTERLTFTRGPNSILFGIAQPGGLTNAVSKRARHTRKFGDVSSRIDNEGSFRYSGDWNLPIIDDVLAIRLAAVRDDREFWFSPEYQNFAGQYAAVNFRPFAKSGGWLRDLDINFNFEQGDTEAQRLGRWEPIYDFITPWIEAGRPMVETIGKTSGPGGGLDTVTRGNIMVVVENGGVPNLNWRLMATGQKHPPSSGDVQGNRSLLDQSIIPFDLNYLGGSRRYTDEFINRQLIISKELLEGLHFEAAFNQQTYDREAIEEMRSRGLSVDPNVYLPNGDPNPYAGMFYMEGPIVVNQPFNKRDSEHQRYSLSYEYDFKGNEGLTRHLGRIRTALSYERSVTDEVLQYVRLNNLTPALTNETLGLKGGGAFRPAVNHGQNGIRLRYYFDPNGDEQSGPLPMSERYGYPEKLYFAGDEIPQDQADASGSTLGYIAYFRGTNRVTELKSKVAALQWYLLNDRIVGTFGWREDDQVIWDAVDAILDDQDPVTLIYPDPRNYDAKEEPVFASFKGETTTTGIVALPFEWLGVFYNRSENFEPGGQGFDIFGEALPSRSGEGEDYGIKLFLWEDKLSASVNFFKTSANNQASGYIRTGAATTISNNFNTETNFLWEQIADYTGDTKYMRSPYFMDKSRFWQGLQSEISEGVEIQIVYNPTPRWRMMFTYSEQESTLQDIGPRMDRYYFDFLPSVWQEEWNDVQLPGPRQFASGVVSSLGEHLAALQEDAVRIKSLEGTTNTRQPLRSFNLVTSYSFSRQSILKGFSIGGTVRYRGDQFLGFPLAEDGISLDTGNAYKGGDTLYFDAMLRYQRPLFKNKVTWVIQLNVRNVLDEDDLLPRVTAGDRSPTVVRWNFPTPRLFTLTNTFRF